MCYGKDGGEMIIRTKKDGERIQNMNWEHKRYRVGID